LNEPQFLYLTTVGWKTGKQHRIEIWYVKQNRKYYVMSELGESAHWVRNIRHSPRISFIVDGLNFDGEARIVHPMKESRLVAAVSELMKVKYKWDQGLIVGTHSIKFW
jgi:deazaflavin-dependent oxidoreductase (nitroreductase family)